MFKSIIATTFEADSPDEAVREILDGIDFDELLPVTLAYLFCPSVYYDNGVVGRLQKELPFPVIGVNTACSVANGEVSSDLLSVSVITGDDIRVKFAVFQCGGSLAENTRRAVTEVISEEYPNLLLMVGGLSSKGDNMVVLDAVDEVTGGYVPLYANIACPSVYTMSTAGLYINGECHAGAYMLAALSGNITATYHMRNISGEFLAGNFDFVTKSENNIVREINNIPATEHLKKIGMFPPHPGHVYMFRDSKGLSYARAPFINIAEGQTHVVLTGGVTENSRVSFCTVTAKEVARTCEDVLEEVKPLLADAKLVLLSSCLARFVVTSMHFDEYMAMADALKDVNHLGAVSGGEFCPVKRTDIEGYTNAFHNFTITACILKQLHD